MGNRAEVQRCTGGRIVGILTRYLKNCDMRNDEQFMDGQGLRLASPHEMSLFIIFLQLFSKFCLHFYTPFFTKYRYPPVPNIRLSVRIVGVGYPAIRYRAGYKKTLSSTPLG